MVSKLLIGSRKQSTEGGGWPSIRKCFVLCTQCLVRSRWKSSQLELTDFGDAVTGAAAGAAAGELAT